MRSSSLVAFVAMIMVASLNAVASQSNTINNNLDDDSPESLEELLAWTETVTNTDWEWVLIRINNNNNNNSGIENADFWGAADPQVIVTALNATDIPVKFHQDRVLSQFTYDVQQGTNDPEWYEIGIVAFERGTVSQLEILLQDVDLLSSSDDLIRQVVDIPNVFDKWVEYLLSQDESTLNVSLRRTYTPIHTPAEQAAMNLTELLLDLEDGSIASLAYNKDLTNNSKAVLYFPGRSESFAHPNVLKMYQEMGYDFYTLDPRFCGRTRRFMNETTFRFAHSIENYDTYNEEIAFTLDFIRNTKNYTNILAHVHSTGALVALNYVMSVDEDPFDGYILNGPFLDWGLVGGSLSEAVLENADKLDLVGIDLVVTGTGLSLFHTRSWIVNRYNTTWRPLIRTHITAEWAQASTVVQQKITDTPTTDPITKQPVLLIASLGDNTIYAVEAQERMEHVAANYSEVIMTHNAHDVTASATQELNADATFEISNWIAEHFDTRATILQAGDGTTPPVNRPTESDTESDPAQTTGTEATADGDGISDGVSSGEASSDSGPHNTMLLYCFFCLVQLCWLR